MFEKICVIFFSISGFYGLPSVLPSFFCYFFLKNEDKLCNSALHNISAVELGDSSAQKRQYTYMGAARIFQTRGSRLL